MSTSGERRREALVRADQQGLARGSNETESLPVRRGGLLQQPEQHPGGDAEETIPVAFLLAYVRQLIRARPSSDLHFLTMQSAKRMVPITPEQEALFVKAVLHEAGQSHWPKGFF